MKGEKVVRVKVTEQRKISIERNFSHWAIHDSCTWQFAFGLAPEVHPADFQRGFLIEPVSYFSSPQEK